MQSMRSSKTAEEKMLNIYEFIVSMVIPEEHRIWRRNAFLLCSTLPIDSVTLCSPFPEVFSFHRNISSFPIQINTKKGENLRTVYASGGSEPIAA